MALPDSSRDDFGDRRFGISDWFGQKIFGNGCDYPLRPLDYASWLSYGLVFAYLCEKFFPLV